MVHAQEAVALDRHDRNRRHHAMQAVGLKRRPGLAAVFAARLPHRAVTLENEEPLASVGCREAMNARTVGGRFPILGHGQPIAPGQAAVGTHFEHGRRASVTQRICAIDGLAVGHQHGGGMAQVLAGLPFDDHLPRLVVREINCGNSVFVGLRAARQEASGGREAVNSHRTSPGAKGDFADCAGGELFDLVDFFAVDGEDQRGAGSGGLEFKRLALLHAWLQGVDNLRLVTEARSAHKHPAGSALETEMVSSSEDERGGALGQIDDSQFGLDVEVAGAEGRLGHDEVAGFGRFDEPVAQDERFAEGFDCLGLAVVDENSCRLLELCGGANAGPEGDCGQGGNGQ